MQGADGDAMGQAVSMDRSEFGWIIAGRLRFFGRQHSIEDID
jgi:hypothetical protein